MMAFIFWAGVDLYLILDIISEYEMIDIWNFLNA